MKIEIQRRSRYEVGREEFILSVNDEVIEANLNLEKLQKKIKEIVEAWY